MKNGYGLLLALLLALPGLSSAQTILNPTDDAYIQSSAETEAKGTTDPNRLWVRTASTLTRLTYIKFNLGSITGITNAKLRLTVDAALPSTAGAAFRTDVVAAAGDDWSESTITFANAPAAGTTALAGQEFQQQSSTDPDQTYDIDVTEYVRAQAEGDKIVTLVLRDMVSSTDVRIHSKEADGGVGPKLVLTATGTAVEDGPEAPAFSARLSGPNPSRTGAEVALTADAPGELNAEVYDVLGRRVARIADGAVGAGARTLRWDAGDAPSGLYFVRITLNGRSLTLPVTLAR